MMRDDRYTNESRDGGADSHSDFDGGREGAAALGHAEEEKKV